MSWGGTVRLSGDHPASLVATYLEHQAELRRFLRARRGSDADLDDLVQDLFLKVSAVDPGQEIANPLAFLYRLAGNVMLDRLRAERRAQARDTEWRRSQTTELGGQEVATIADAESTVIAKQRLTLVVSALETLALPTRRAFQLHKFSGLSHAETAARMGISKSAVEKHISLALKHLAIKLGEVR